MTDFSVYAAVYAAVVSRPVFVDGVQVSVSWESRRRRADTEARVAVAAAATFAAGYTGD